MRWGKKKVLVTGAEGFIGSHLVEQLVDKGAQVTAFVLYNSFNSWGWLDTFSKSKLRKIKVVLGDIRSTQSVDVAMEGVDYVFHLAALIGIPFSYHSQDLYVDTNIKGTLNVLQFARKYKVQKVIHTSTSEVYGTAQYVPIDEKHPINPQSPYAATKAAADYLALSFYRSFDLPVDILRPFNVFGPRQSARAVIPTIITQILSGKKDIFLGNIETTRDFNYVDNTTDAFLKLAATTSVKGEIYNAGTNSEISMRDLVDMIAKVVNRKVKIVQDKVRIRPEKSEVMRLCCDFSKIKQRCGWRPVVSLEEGIRRTCSWMKDNLTEYKIESYTI